MSEIDPFPEISGADPLVVCPFLGLAEDLQGSLSYPSPGNFCHRTRPYGTPNIDFQRSFCFSEAYSNCPVLTRTGRGPMPSDIRWQDDKPFVEKRILLLILIGGMLALFGIGVAFWKSQDHGGHGGNLQSTTVSLSLPATLPYLPTDTLPSTDTPATPAFVPVTESATPFTPVPTLSPTLTPTLTFTASPTRRPVHFYPTFTPTLTFVFPHAPTSTPPTPASTSTSVSTPVPTDTSVPTAAPTNTSAPTATSGTSETQTATDAPTATSAPSG